MNKAQIVRNFEKVLTARLGERLNFIQVILGPRQVGKTTALERIVKNWSGPKLFVSADSPIPPDYRWLQMRWREAEDLGDDTLFVIDEIQKIQNWANTIKPLFDRIRSKRSMKIVLLGSASLSIQDGLSESLAGRFEVIQAGHWSFKECASEFNLSFSEYLQFGGYPAGLELRQDLSRWQKFLRDSIVEPVLGRDLQGSVKISKPALFRQSFEVAMGLPAQIISYAKFLGQLQEGGNAETIRYYLLLFEAAYLLKLLPKYSKGEINKRASKPKLIPLDPGLITAFTQPNRIIEDPSWRGRVVETVFAAHLVRQEGELYYWSDGHYEVDLVHELRGEITAYEIKSGSERKAKSLTKFIERYPKAKGRVLGLDEIEQMIS